MTYLTIAEAVKATRKGAYARGVAAKVLPGLIERGVIRGETIDGETRIVDDEAFRATMRLGIERFVDGLQGWSLVAVEAPIDAVADLLRARPGVLAYEPGTKVAAMKKAILNPDPEPRHYFLVRTAASEWSVLLQTIHWISTADMALGVQLAIDLSAALGATAVAAWDDDFSGSTLVAFDGGQKTLTLSDGGPDKGAGWHRFFYERGISLPECFIAEADPGARLHAKPAAEVVRADHLTLEMPPELQQDTPHVLSKLGMMAMAADADDEEGFRALMRKHLGAEARDVPEPDPD